MRNLTRKPGSAWQGVAFNAAALLFLAVAFLPAGPVKSQAPDEAKDIEKKLEFLPVEPVKSKAPKKGTKDIEKKLDELAEEVKDLKGKLKKLKDDKSAESLLTLGDVDLKLGGKVEFNFLDSGDDEMEIQGGPVFTSEYMDPHLELQRFRLAPVFELNRWVKIQAQLDFETTGDTTLKELAVRHDVQPLWWLRSRFQLGLDDRFIRPARRTKTYPLIGNAFWRDESLAAVWQLSFGHRKGTVAARERFVENRGGGGSGSGAFTEGFEDDYFGDEDSGAPAARRPFDFRKNWGSFSAFLSLGQGYELGNKEVTFDSARFNEIVQDDRELEDDLAFGELGIGFGWRRSFEQFGDLGISGFYFSDNLREGSLEFLHSPSMTNETGGSVDSGYGDSGADSSSRLGMSLDYFLAAKSIFPRWKKDVRKQDGLRLALQYIKGKDGQLVRDGWYTQASYRFSFGKLLADRYFRSVEPLVRYGVLNVDAPGEPGKPFKAPSLPGTWDRQALTLGALIEVTGDIFMKFEYVMNSEDGNGAGVDVDNDEMLLQLLLTF